MNGRDYSILKRTVRSQRRRHYRDLTQRLAEGDPATTGHGRHVSEAWQRHTGDTEPVTDKLREQIARVQAEFENFRKRTRRDHQQKIETATQGLLKELLPVLDNFDRALSQPGESVEALHNGMEMVHNQLVTILKREGLEKVSALDQTFDPNHHEAVMTAPVGDGQKDNQVIDVLQDGYLLKNRLMRPAMVRVARHETSGETPTPGPKPDDSQPPPQ